MCTNLTRLSVHLLRQAASSASWRVEMSGRSRNNKLRDEPRLFQTGETDGRHAPCITSLASPRSPGKKIESSVLSGKCFLSPGPPAEGVPTQYVVNQVSISQQERVRKLSCTSSSACKWKRDPPGDGMTLMFL